MKPKLETVRQLIQNSKSELKKFGVFQIYVFGSVARGEENAKSDVDIFVDFGPEGTDFFTLIDLADFLSIKLKSKVDLATKGSLHPMLKEQILREAIRVA